MSRTEHDAVIAWNIRPIDTLLREIRDQLLRRAELRDVLNDLQVCEAACWRPYDHQVDESPEAKHASVLLQRIGDTVRAALAIERSDQLIEQLDAVLARSWAG